MFATFTYSQFPIIHVHFNSTILHEQDFTQFTDEWLRIYSLQTYFTLIFDTSQISYIPLIYSIRMAQFIQTLKQQPIQYLQQSIMIVTNQFVQTMLSIIFHLQSPVAPIYIITDKSQIQSILDHQSSKDHQPSKDIICIQPGDSIIPFF